MTRSTTSIREFEVGDLVVANRGYHNDSMRNTPGIITEYPTPSYEGRTGDNRVMTVDWGDNPNYHIVVGDVNLHTKKADVVPFAEEFNTKFPWLRPLLDEMYGENYDIIDAGVRMEIIIKYPEVTITNSRKNKHTIRDLYVKLTIGREGLKPSLQGWRQTRTIKEWDAAYKHSHLPSGTENRFSTFCLGHGTSIVDALVSAKMEPSEDTFFQLSCVLDNYVRWESLEGGPHFRMGDIGNRQGSSSSTGVTSTDISNTRHALITSGVTIPLKYDERAYIPKVTLDRTNKDFIKALNEAATKKIKRHKVTQAQLQLVQASSRSNLEALVQQFNTETPLFSFRGEPVKRQLFDASVATDVNMEEYYDAIHPDLERHVIDKMEAQLRKFITNGEVK